MSATYRPVTWNRNKQIYDVVLLAVIVLYVLAYMGFARAFVPESDAIDLPILRMRAYGSCTFLLLSVILCIGPLARLDTRFLPLLYNRRHFGVITCAMALAHASFVLGWYFAYSPADPFAAVLSSNASYGRFIGFPFELFGVFALLILLVMAATSHDFWLSFLTPPVWKALHMGVYAAYGALVAHIVLGPLQAETGHGLFIVTGMSVLIVCTLHGLAAWKSAGTEGSATFWPDGAGWVEAGPVAGIAEGRAITITLKGAERVAIFRNRGTLSAVENACRHQNGPLGEGRIIDGCITCPWHGFQYRPEDGCAPPPFTEKLATYRLKLVNGMVLLDPRPNLPGTFVAPLVIGGDDMTDAKP